MKKQKKDKGTILIDFDGPIHRFSRGWENGKIYDKPSDEVKCTMKKLTDAGYKVVIFCARLTKVKPEYGDFGHDPKLEKEKMREWLYGHGIKKGTHYQFMTNEKIGCLAQIDDRAIRFENNWKSIAKLFV